MAIYKTELTICWYRLPCLIDSEAIVLVDKLVKARIPKETATELVDFIEKHQSEKIEFKLNIILWVLAGLLTLVIYLHSDLKSGIKENRESIKQIHQELKSMIEKIDRLLIK